MNYVFYSRFTHCIIKKYEITVIVTGDEVHKISFTFLIDVIMSFWKFKGCTNRTNLIVYLYHVGFD